MKAASRIQALAALAIVLAVGQPVAAQDATQTISSQVGGSGDLGDTDKGIGGVSPKFDPCADERRAIAELERKIANKQAVIKVVESRNPRTLAGLFKKASEIDTLERKILQHKSEIIRLTILVWGGTC